MNWVKSDEVAAALATIDAAGRKSDLTCFSFCKEADRTGDE
jgi:hypothetical protein